MSAAARKKRKARDPEATREALLRAATELFALEGYDGVKVDALARRAGVNKALVSYYFGGKRNLYRAAIESGFRELSALASGLRDESRPPMELLRGFIQGFGALASERRPYFPALFLRETLSTGELAPEARGHARAILGAFRGVLKRGADEGSFRPVDPGELYLHLVGSLAFFFATEPARRHLARKGKLPVSLPSRRSYVSFVEKAVTRSLAPDSNGARP